MNYLDLIKNNLLDKKNKSRYQNVKCVCYSSIIFVCPVLYCVLHKYVPYKCLLSIIRDGSVGRVLDSHTEGRVIKF